MSLCQGSSPLNHRQSSVADSLRTPRSSDVNKNKSCFDFCLHDLDFQSHRTFGFLEVFHLLGISRDRVQYIPQLQWNIMMMLMDGWMMVNINPLVDQHAIYTVRRNHSDIFTIHPEGNLSITTPASLKSVNNNSD